MVRAVSTTLIIVAVVGVLVMTSIQGGGSNDAGQMRAGADRPSILMATFFAEMLPGLRAAAADFERETGIHVTVQGMPYTSYVMWVRTQLLSKRPPELILLDDTMIPRFYGQAGLLEELSAEIQRQNEFAPDIASWEECFRKPYVQVCRDEAARLWCLPLTEFSVGFFYNADVYARVGVEVPTTWRELVENMRALHAAGETPLITAIGPNDYQTAWMAAILEEWLQRKYIPDVNIDSSPGWKFDVNDPSTVVDERIAIDERIIAFERGIIDPARSPEYAEILRLIRQVAQYWRIEHAGVDTTELEKFFLTSQSVHMMNGTWYLMNIQNQMRIMAEVAPQRVFKWSVFPFPSLDETDSPLATAGGINQHAGIRSCLMIPKQPEAPQKVQLALQFARFLTSPRGSTLVMSGEDVFDNPAVVNVTPRAESTRLLADQNYAFLPVSAFIGYDAQSYHEFWALWQQWFAHDIDDHVFLEALSRSHRDGLARLTRDLAGEVNFDLIRRELGALPEWLGVRE